MDTKLPNSKLDPELTRYQKVLDAYHAFPGDSPEPPGSLDQLILTRAQSALAPATPAKTGALRRWPMAIAASVATIGFAALLARHSLREPAPSFDSAPAMRQVQETQTSLPPAKALEQDQSSAAGQNSAAGAMEQSEPAPAQMPPVASAPEPAEKRAPSAPSAVNPQIVASVPEPAAASAAAIPVEAAKLDAMDVGRSQAKQAVQEPLIEEAEPLAEPQLDSAPMQAMPAAPAPAAAMAAAAPVLSESKESTDSESVASEGSADVAAGAIAPEPMPASSDQSMRDEKPDDAANSRARRGKREAFGLTAEPDADQALFKRVRELRAQAKLEQARTLLMQFQSANPEKEIPQDLKELLQP